MTDLNENLSAAPAPEGGAGDDWRPIGSAPQDGTKIDLWGHWPEHDRWTRTPDAVWDEEQCDWKVNGFYAGQYAHPPRFTHWRAISGPATLAAREEAPAEAAAKRLRDDLDEGRIKDFAVSRDVATILSALRAQPPARSRVSEDDAKWLLENYGPTSPRIERIANALLSQPPAREEEVGTLDPVFVAWLKERDCLPNDDDGTIEWADIVCALNDLEADLTPAREDAQPVGWLDAAQKKAVERAAMDAGAYSWRNARLAMVEGNKVIGYPAFSRADMAELARLHTHPAPDALRVAVEALERIATVDMGGGFLGAQACRQVATKALSDMKANQKGGA
ncbi:hypothetical protein [Brevundimonas diminuta]|uniref:hypothetical protein n=1 Tax=Brevundimonas diminuta TaxID=293 RepID=UPI0030FA7A37